MDPGLTALAILVLIAGFAIASTGIKIVKP